ncbi:Ribosomal RNA small subunit methyltransferase G [subsurface metagenome]
MKAEGNELIIRHSLDSLAGLKCIRDISPLSSVIDIGSGAGFPGLPLAIFLQETGFTLLERSSKRAAFLRNVVLLLGLTNVEVVEQELKNLRRGFDLVTFRALSPLCREIESLKAILKHGGRIAAYKGKRSRILQELEELTDRNIPVSIQRLKAPFLEEDRHLVLLGPILMPS